MNNSMLPLPGLSSACGKPVVVKFDGGLLSSDGGVLALREVEQRLRVADRLAACMIDPRAADQITHSLAGSIRFRLLMISAGYEDGNDAKVIISETIGSADEKATNVLCGMPANPWTMACMDCLHRRHRRPPRSKSMQPPPGRTPLHLARPIPIAVETTTLH